MDKQDTQARSQRESDTCCWKLEGLGCLTRALPLRWGIALSEVPDSYIYLKGKALVPTSQFDFPGALMC